MDALNLFSWSTEPTLGIFQKHFVVRHCLYRLQAEKCSTDSSDFRLQITPTIIQLKPTVSASDNQLIVDDNSIKLAEYYLNLTNLDNATSENVSKILANFWKNFHAYEDREIHLTQMGLSKHASWEQIQSRYRELAKQYHPDKGGDDKKFIKLRRAFEALKRLRKL